MYWRSWITLQSCLLLPRLFCLLLSLGSEDLRHPLFLQASDWHHLYKGLSIRLSSNLVPIRRFTLECKFCAALPAPKSIPLLDSLCAISASFCFETNFIAQLTSISSFFFLESIVLSSFVIWLLFCSGHFGNRASRKLTFFILSLYAVSPTRRIRQNN